MEKRIGTVTVLVKDRAVAPQVNAVISQYADIILAPQYVLTTKDYFLYKSINCKVKGFPGFVKGIEVVESPKNAELVMRR